MTWDYHCGLNRHLTACFLIHKGEFWSEVLVIRDLTQTEVSLMASFLSGASDLAYYLELMDVILRDGRPSKPP